MTNIARKPLPDRQDIDNGRFWDGTARGELQVKHCAGCGRHHWPPRQGCPHCGSADIAWAAVPTRGRIYSWTVIHRSQTPGFEADTPYAVVLVELSEAKGVRMIGNLVNCSADRLKGGMPVEAVFSPSEDGSVTLVNWQPTPETAG